MIEAIYFNETHMKLRFDDYGVEQECNEFFCFFAAGYKYMPSFKSGMWDGKVRLHNGRTKTLPIGLLDVLYKFAKQRDYEIKIDAKLNNSMNVSHESVVQFMNDLNLHGRGKPLEIREYQYEAVHRMIANKRAIILAATSAGKSAMIYSKIRWHLAKQETVLLIVPTVNLVTQMFGDFQDYSTANGFSVEDNVHMLYAGKDRVFDKGVTISTWQSLMSMKKDDPKNFKVLVDTVDCIIADEAHTFKSNVVMGVIESFSKTPMKIGTSGTLDGTTVNELTLIGLFGPVHKIVTAKQMMDAGQVTPVSIRVMVLKHPPEYCKALKGMDYKEEINQIVANPARNRFIANLSLACSGNTLILYNFVERHAKLILSEIQKKVAEGRNVYFIHGGVDADERDRIRKIVEKEDNAIILATSSLFATGTNIPSLENIIFAAPGKSNIRIRQSIGRGIRLKEGKTVAKIFDIADDYKYKAWTNTTYRHMESRLAIYVSEQFEYTIKQLDLAY